MKKPQLFLLHFAGGNCYSFQFLISYLKDFEVIPLELPGRGRRMDEELLKDFELAAIDFYNQIIQKLADSDFLIYGHSMGAYLALRVTNMLENTGRVPAYVFVSGNAGPGIRENRIRHLMERQDFVDELKKLGGVPDELLKDQELFDLFEPILRADFEIAEKNEIDKAPATGAPLLAIMGSEEEDTGQIANWGRYTRSQFGYEILEGDHFFIHRHPQRIACLIRHCYDITASFQY